MESSESYIIQECSQDIDPNINKSENNTNIDKTHTDPIKQPILEPNPSLNSEPTSESLFKESRIQPECLKDLMSNEYQRV